MQPLEHPGPVAADRRTFLKSTLAAAAGASVLGRLSQAHAADVTALVPGKDARLIVHTSEPIVLEAPLDLLADEQVTPTARLFVRNCQGLPPGAIDKTPQLANWQLELAGLIDRPQKFDAGWLQGLPRVEVEMVVQCSGNSRSLFSQTAPTKGTQWGRGGMGNVRFAGVRLAEVLERKGVHPQSSAKFLTAQGSDEPKRGESDFEHSLPLNEVLEKSLLAWELNGQPLPMEHGGPLRLITPGYYGTMQVKWLTRLVFTDGESTHTSQVPNYRTPLRPIAPGTKFEATLANSEPNWRMRLKSVVLSPLPGAKLPPGETQVAGVAFNDGEARIDSVLVSIDRGNSWQRAELNVPESPYAWYRWSAKLPLAAGQQQIWARAVDTLGRTQPLDGSVFWNPQGYTWNGVEKIDVQVG